MQRFANIDENENSKFHEIQYGQSDDKGIADPGNRVNYLIPEDNVVSFQRASGI